MTKKRIYFHNTEKNKVNYITKHKYKSIQISAQGQIILGFSIKNQGLLLPHVMECSDLEKQNIHERISRKL